jgi:hypothetical protein
MSSLLLYLYLIESEEGLDQNDEDICNGNFISLAIHKNHGAGFCFLDRSNA